ncbi:hypothetical protein [Agarilytica rhodophyticola]|uniref:hypothetical protein n=1 Tax=Agarilytica rhodophyticola TaxID=1737490 RepID=UPI000B3497E1|nr:hypothetical protein [Agarilytica rhodophyticola]
MGTWALPKTKKIANDLQVLMKKPIPCNQATHHLVDIIGDDDLYDLLDELEGDFDIRPIIRDFLSEVITQRIDYNNNDWDKEALRICTRLTSP